MFVNENLPDPIAQFIAAIGNLDNEALAASFSEDAILIDEGKEYRGRTSISHWCTETMIAHRATVTVQNVNRDGDQSYLSVTMDGDFENDYGITEPFPLYFYFTTTATAIRSLRITDLDPDTPTMFAVYAARGDLNNPFSALRVDRRMQPAIPNGWVCVKVRAAAVNFHDIFTLRGISMVTLKFPLTLGCEASGTLDDGTEVLLYPVMGDPNYKGDETLDPARHVFSELTNGTFAEYVVAPRRNVVECPKGLSPIAGSVLGIAWLTAYRMLFTQSGLRAGQTMLVQGSSGGVATALIQLGSAAGMIVWATGRSTAKRALAFRLGASQTFKPNEQLPNLVDAVFDVSGGPTWAHTMASVKAGGTVVTCGMHGGEHVDAALFRLFTQQIRVVGSYAGSLDEFRDLIAFVVAKGIEPHIGKVLPMEKAEEALRDVWEGRTEGKIVLTAGNCPVI